MRFRCVAILSIVILLAHTFPSRAQFRPRVPFFGPGVVAFNPEISVINSGALLDAQPVVSSDRKYVTITMRPQLSTLIDLQAFTFQTNLGNVGGVGTPQAAGSVLAQQGMMRLAPAR